MRFSSEVEQVLRRSGWFPGRQVEIETWRVSLALFQWHEEAERFLREFGGIRVDLSGPGITTAKERFEIDPELATGEEGRFMELSEKFQRSFFPLGEVGPGGEFLLAVDEEGSLYLLGAWAYRVGGADNGIEHLVTGVKAERLSVP